MPLSLKIGTIYGKHLCRLHNKPFIPIHHMEAHALTARMHDRSLEFPFLVLLISGGHCLLAVAEKVDRFLLLGESIDDAPGETFDKVTTSKRNYSKLKKNNFLDGQKNETEKYTRILSTVWRAGYRKSSLKSRRSFTVQVHVTAAALQRLQF